MTFFVRSRFYIVPDGQYGALKADGTSFNGVIGELQAGRGNAGFAAFAMTSIRNNVADPSIAYCQYE